MKNIINMQIRNEIIDRISNLKHETPGLWGTMNVNGMICHITDQVRMATGKLETRNFVNWYSKSILKHLVLWGMPVPKGKIRTVRELDQDRDGTKPTAFENDIRLLIEEIKTFEEAFKEENQYRHPTFGLMNKRQWGRLVYLHLDHHLRQFGV